MQFCVFRKKLKQLLYPERLNLSTGNPFHFKPFNFTLTPNISENILAVWYRVENIFPEYLAELNYLFSMAAWTELAAPAGKGEQVFVMAIGAANTGKALFQITAFEVGPHNLGDNRTVKTILFCETFIIDLLKPVKMVQEQPVQRRVGRLTVLQGLLDHYTFGTHFLPLKHSPTPDRDPR